MALDIVKLKLTLQRLEILRDQLAARITQVRGITGGTTGEVVTVANIWGSVKDYTLKLFLLNQAIEINNQNIGFGIPKHLQQQVAERYARQLKDGENLLRQATRFINMAEKELNSPLPTSAKEKEQIPEAKKEPKPPTLNEPVQPLPVPEVPQDSPEKPAKRTPSIKQTAQEDPPKPSEIKALARDRTKLIDDIIARMEKQIGTAQEDLLRRIVDDFVEELDQDENGAIKNTLANKRKIALLDRVYNKYVQETGIQVVKTIVDSVGKIMDFNGKYYGVFTTKAQLGNIMTDTKTQIGDWLGITKRGGLVENGYLNRLLTDPTIRNTVRDSAFKSVVSQKGFFETKADLKNYIQGNPGQTGALQKYYRNFVFDTFSQVDRTQAKIFADKLGFNYAIYEGGLIETSRPFCKARNGKVFTREEIEKFDPPEAKQPNYNAFTDLGGYGCRHHLNWVPDAVAFALRPELRQTAAA
jgi:hypothetical protein